MRSDAHSEIARLRERVAYIEKANKRIVEALNSAADLGDFRPEYVKYQNPKGILQDTAFRLIRLASFESVGLWLVDENTADLRIESCEPEKARPLITGEFERLADEGIISLALTGEKPVIAAGSRPDDRYMVQAVATASRVRGLLIGQLKAGKGLPDALQPLVIILCQICAASLEAMELYRLLREKQSILEENEDRFNSVMAAINDGIWDWDIPSGRVYFDERYYMMAGYDPDEFAHRIEEFEKRIHPDDRDRVLGHIADHLTGRVARFDVVFRFLKKDGDWLWIRGRGRIVGTDDQGVPVRIVGTHTDITESKQSEEARKKLQDQLNQAQKMETVGILAGGIAHDFNNLLQIMGGNVELLLKSMSHDREECRRLGTLARNIERASELVRRLLTFSRKTKKISRLVDLNDEIRHASTMLERTIPKMVDIQMDLDESLWKIIADNVQIEQVLLNLGSNAADAMPDGGKLLIRTFNVFLDEDQANVDLGLAAGPYAVLLVSDTGTGMNSETKARIFEPFFTTKETGKGTGLGLATVYGIVKAHRGHVFCESEPGRGTMFTIYWPAVESGQVHESICDSSKRVDQLSGYETILVVDDEEDILELTREVLNDFGYSVFCVSRGRQALEMYRDNPGLVDLVILDLNMPEMSGKQCLRELLQTDPNVRVLIASGHSELGLASEAINAGASGFIGKPYRIEELGRKVREILDAPTSHVS